MEAFTHGCLNLHVIHLCFLPSQLGSCYTDHSHPAGRFHHKNHETPHNDASSSNGCCMPERCMFYMNVGGKRRIWHSRYFSIFHCQCIIPQREGPQFYDVTMLQNNSDLTQKENITKLHLFKNREEAVIPTVALSGQINLVVFIPVVISIFFSPLFFKI